MKRPCSCSCSMLSMRPSLQKLVLLMAAVLSCAQPAWADSRDEEIRLLKAQLAQLSARLEKLEQASASSKKPPENAPEIHKAQPLAKAKGQHDKPNSLQHPDFKHWPHRIAFNADLRYRQEYIDEKGKDTRFRHRIRFRTGMKMNLSPDILLGFQLASGDDNPVSNNVTLDHAFSNKDIRLNKAYVKWKFSPRLTGEFGKFSNPFDRPNKTPLVWDNDLIPEGAALTFAPGGYEAVLGWFSVEERKTDKDTQLWGAQLRKSFTLAGGDRLKLVASYYDYLHLQGFAPLYDGKSRGNLLDTNGAYLSDYNEFELFGEYHTHVGQWPLLVFADYTQNTATETDQDTAWTAGAQLGKAKKTGTWQFSLAWLSTDAESVVGLFNDSDFAGGNVNAKGALFKFKYAINAKTYAGLTYIDSQKGKDSDNPVDYDRLQVDVGWKF